MSKYSWVFPTPFILLYFLIVLPTPQSAKWQTLKYRTLQTHSFSQSKHNRNDFKRDFQWLLRLSSLDPGYDNPAMEWWQTVRISLVIKADFNYPFVRLSSIIWVGFTEIWHFWINHTKPGRKYRRSYTTSEIIHLSSSNMCDRNEAFRSQTN